MGMTWVPPTPVERQLYEAGLRGDEGALAAHRLLTDDEGSPWRNIPWR
ncbi:hypothetical protein AB0J57_20825 [Streptomyces sp. NPDC049837]